jgi:rRNA processing protein Krr1/Pno1
VNLLKIKILVIGKDGRNIKSIQTETGTRIFIKDSSCNISGTDDSIKYV